MVGLIVWMDYRQRQRGGRIKLGGPETTPPRGGASEESESNSGQEATAEQNSKLLSSSQPLPGAP
ncbi:MAG: hypothetical protein NVS9B9_15350 [Ktedonobacteraceae bacterium]